MAAIVTLVFLLQIAVTKLTWGEIALPCAESCHHLYTWNCFFVVVVVVAPDKDITFLMV